MDLYGLIGKSLKHSFSPSYFESKFQSEKLNARYELIEVQNTGGLNKIPFFKYSGLNVTIPYKKDILKLCDHIDDHANSIGAVNTLKVLPNNKLKGYNTDWIGFMNALTPLLKPEDKNALVLGTGGSSKAVLYALKQLGIQALQVSRSNQKADFTYSELTIELLNSVQIIINTTPVGMFPHVNDLPPLPVSVLTKKQLVYDLIYNPDPTLLLKQAKQAGCRVKSGYEMLKLQAEESRKIWKD